MLAVVGAADKVESRKELLQPVTQKNLLSQSLEALKSDCKNALGSAANSSNAQQGFNAFQQHVSKLTFHDGREEGSMSLAGSRNGLSFADFHTMFPSVEATTLLNRSGRPSNHVVLWHDFFGNNQYARPLIEQQVTLIHELTHHSYFRLGRQDHADVGGRLNIRRVGNESFSDALNRWIGDCLR